MPLTEDEEFELLSLERERAMANQQSSQKEQPDNRSIPQMLLGNLVDAAKGTGEAALKTANEATFGAVGGITKAMTGKDLPEESMDEQTKQMATGAALAAPLPLGIVAEGVTKKASQILKPFLKFDNSLKQAEKGKEALDTLRTTIGQAKDLAIKDVENVPTQLSLKNVRSNKITKAIKNPVYEVAFNPDGTLVQTVGNLDKVKKAVGELVHTPSLWEEAPKTEIQHVKQIYGQINQAMKNAAQKVGKPIDKALSSYDKFMDNYMIVNKTLVDKAGVAKGNALKEAFRIQAEPAIKKAWKEVASASPEAKSVMDSMKRRELLKNLIKYGGSAALTIEGGKKLITGHF